jgi:hypothetical protein
MRTNPSASREDSRMILPKFSASKLRRRLSRSCSAVPVIRKLLHRVQTHLRFASLRGLDSADIWQIGQLAIGGSPLLGAVVLIYAGRLGRLPSASIAVKRSASIRASAPVLKNVRTASNHPIRIGLLHRPVPDAVLLNMDRFVCVHVANMAMLDRYAQHNPAALSAGIGLAR